MTSRIVRALPKDAQHRIVAWRHKVDARARGFGKRPPAANLRAWELEKIFRYRFGKFIPCNADGREALRVIAEAYRFAKGGDLQSKLTGYVRARAPWATSEVDAIAAAAATACWQSADELAWRIKLSPMERERLEIRTIGAVGLNKRRRSAIQKTKHKQRESARRKANGAKPHAESLNRTRPWEAEGISRRTWFRRRAREAGTNSCDVFSSNSNAHESVPPSARSLRDALRAGPIGPGLRPRRPEQVDSSAHYFEEGREVQSEARA
ncbi:hypothetical protein SAMN05192541_124113 [Bradyrhizobium arachidis]|nr:hypothetical protein SAMN05192541_124113 [Bradyrhizobium arachidis]